MQRRIGAWIGLSVILAACGSPQPAAVGRAPQAPARGEAAAEVVPVVPHAAKPGREATGSLVITFQNPRTSFTSDKIDLKTGKTLPADDGMSPEGDISFFYDGSRFQIIANAGGGANRSLAPAESGKPAGEFAMAPIPLREGSQVLLRQDHGGYIVTITGLKAGSMTFLPTGTGTGTGSVTFSYQPSEGSAVSHL